MKKLLTVFALTSFTAVFSQITITSNLPANINTGASIDAEVKINKGAVSNFAKYQMDVPTGYVVSAIEIKGGNFTFENLDAAQLDELLRHASHPHHPTDDEPNRPA